MDIMKIFGDVCMRNKWQLTGRQATLPIEGGRTQVIELERFQFQGEDMARIFTLVGPADELSTVQLNAILGINFSLAFGALAFAKGQLVMADTFLIRHIDHDQLAFSMNFLAQTADDYERQIYGTDEH